MIKEIIKSFDECEILGSVNSNIQYSEHYDGRDINVLKIFFPNSSFYRKSSGIYSNNNELLSFNKIRQIYLSPLCTIKHIDIKICNKISFIEFLINITDISFKFSFWIKPETTNTWSTKSIIETFKEDIMRNKNLSDEDANKIFNTNNNLALFQILDAINYFEN